MGALQHFEKRLEGAVEGFFARAFRSGLQPIELAKALQRYAEDTQHVTEDGVVVPNVYRFDLSAKDLERLSTFGDQLPNELSDVVVRTADERGWKLRGPVVVRLRQKDDTAYGMYDLAGRVEAVEGQTVPSPTTGANTASHLVSSRGHEVRIVSGGEPGQRIKLTGGRVVVGRLPECGVTLDDPTVSREHAALVQRGQQWWVVDLGSTNGTSVNDTTASEQPLSNGDRIAFGEAVVEFTET